MDFRPITGATRLVALLGDPVAHSLSPAIHNHAFARMGLAFAYVPLPVKKSHVFAAVNALRACGFLGANVTIPHKQTVLPYCDRISEISRRIGVVNTLYFEGTTLCGTTTDYEGFLQSLAWMEIDPRNEHVVILGNGGVSRTLAHALALNRRYQSLTLAGRNADRVALLAAEIAAGSGATLSAIGADDPHFAGTMSRCTLLVNGTSAGMHPAVDGVPLPLSLLHRNLAVLDTVYNPAETRLLSAAKAAGCRAQNGLRMLLFQGLASFALWTGRAVDPEIFDVAELERMVAGGVRATTVKDAPQ